MDRVRTEKSNGASRDERSQSGKEKPKTVESGEKTRAESNSFVEQHEDENGDDKLQADIRNSVKLAMELIGSDDDEAPPAPASLPWDPSRPSLSSREPSPVEASPERMIMAESEERLDRSDSETDPTTEESRVQDEREILSNEQPPSPQREETPTEPDIPITPVPAVEVREDSEERTLPAEEVSRPSAGVRRKATARKSFTQPPPKDEPSPIKLHVPFPEIKPEPTDPDTPSLTTEQSTPEASEPLLLPPSVGEEHEEPATMKRIVRAKRAKAPSVAPSTPRTPIQRMHRGIKTDLSDPGLLKPFEMGFRRELVFRSTGGGADVYYFPPVGKKLRSMNEVGDYLVASGLPLTTANFTFSKSVLIGDEKYEVTRGAATAAGPRSNRFITPTPSMSLPDTPVQSPGAPTAPQSLSRLRTGGIKLKFLPRKRAKTAGTPPEINLAPSTGFDSFLGAESTQVPRVPPLTLSIKALKESSSPPATTNRPRQSLVGGIDVNQSLIGGIGVKTPGKRRVYSRKVVQAADLSRPDIPDVTEIVQGGAEFSPEMSDTYLPLAPQEEPALPQAQISPALENPPMDTSVPQATPVAEEKPVMRKTISVRKASDLFPVTPREKRAVKPPSRFLDTDAATDEAKRTPEVPEMIKIQRIVSVPKQTSPAKGPKSVAPCTVLCYKARGQFPNLSCSKCLCLFHGTCLGYSPLFNPGASFVCPSCYARGPDDEIEEVGQHLVQHVSPTDVLSPQPVSRPTVMRLKFDGNKFAVTKRAVYAPPQRRPPPVFKPAIRYIRPKDGLPPQPAQNEVELTSPALLAIEPPPEQPVDKPQPVTVITKSLRSTSVQTEPEEAVPPKPVTPPPPPPPPPRPVVGCQTIEHIRDRKNRLRRFIVISNTPVSQDRPCPFAPLVEVPEPIPEEAHVPEVEPMEVQEHLVTPVTSAVAKAVAPSSWSSDFVNTLNHAYKGVLHAFSYLTPAERGRAALSCKLWHKIAHEPELWGHVDTKKLKIRSLRNFFARIRKLEINSVDLRGLEGKQRDSLLKYLNMPDAKKIYLCPCPGEAIDLLLRTCSDISLLEAEHITTNSVNLQDVKSHYRMETLVLESDETMSVLNLADLQKLHKMKHLSLLGVEVIEELRFLELMPSLETLRLGNLNELDEEKMKSSTNFRNVKNLRTLRLENGPEWDTSLFLVQCMGSLKELRQLEILHFRAETQLPETLELMPKLEDFLFMPQISIDTSETTFGDLLDHLPKLTNLKTFCLLILEDYLLFDGTVLVRRDTIKRLDLLKPKSPSPLPEEPMDVEDQYDEPIATEEGRLDDFEAGVSDVINDPRIWAALENVQLSAATAQVPEPFTGAVEERSKISEAVEEQEEAVDVVEKQTAPSCASEEELVESFETPVTVAVVVAETEQRENVLQKILDDTVYHGEHVDEQESPAEDHGTASIGDVTEEADVEQLDHAESSEKESPSDQILVEETAGNPVQEQEPGAGPYSIFDLDIAVDSVLPSAPTHVQTPDPEFFDPAGTQKAVLPSAATGMETSEPAQITPSSMFDLDDVPVQVLPSLNVEQAKIQINQESVDMTEEDEGKVVETDDGRTALPSLDESMDVDLGQPATETAQKAELPLSQSEVPEAELNRESDTGNNYADEDGNVSESETSRDMFQSKDPSDDEQSHGKVVFKLGGSENSSVFDDVSKSDSVKAAVNNAVSSLFDIESMDDQPAAQEDSNAAQRSGESVGESESAETQPSILLSYREDQDENAHMGPPTPETAQEAELPLSQSEVPEAESNRESDTGDNSDEEHGINEKEEEDGINEKEEELNDSFENQGFVGARIEPAVSEWNDLSEGESDSESNVSITLHRNEEQRPTGKGLRMNTAGSQYQSLSQASSPGSEIHEDYDNNKFKSAGKGLRFETSDERPISQADENDGPPKRSSERDVTDDPEDENGPDVPETDGGRKDDDPCTVTPEELYEYFKLALPAVKLCVIKVNEDRLRKFKLSSVDWENNSVNID